VIVFHLRGFTSVRRTFFRLLSLLRHPKRSEGLACSSMRFAAHRSDAEERNHCREPFCLSPCRAGALADAGRRSVVEILATAAFAQNDTGGSFGSSGRLVFCVILSVAKGLACSPGRVRRASLRMGEKRSQAKLFCLLSLPACALLTPDAGSVVEILRTAASLRMTKRGSFVSSGEPRFFVSS